MCAWYGTGMAQTGSGQKILQSKEINRWGTRAALSSLFCTQGNKTEKSQWLTQSWSFAWSLHHKEKEMEGSLNSSWRPLPQSCSHIWKLCCFRKWLIASPEVWQPSILVAWKSNACICEDLHTLSGSEVSGTHQASHFLRMFWLPAFSYLQTGLRGLFRQLVHFAAEMQLLCDFSMYKKLDLVENVHFAEGNDQSID